MTKHAKIIGKSEKKQAENMRKMFREVFGSAKGKTCLNILLTDLHYFLPCANEKEVALRNYASFFVAERLGLFDTVKITDCLFEGKEEPSIDNEE